MSEILWTQYLGFCMKEQCSQLPVLIMKLKQVNLSSASTTLSLQKMIYLGTGTDPARINPVS